MDSEESAGAQMHDADVQQRREAARAMGSARTPRKNASSRANAAKAAEARKGTTFSEETKQKLRAAQQARREREKQEQVASGSVPVVSVEKQKPGRPRTRPVAETAEKRPVGRPRKSKPVEEGTAE